MGPILSATPSSLKDLPLDWKGLEGNLESFSQFTVYPGLAKVIHSFTYSLLSTYYVPDAILDSWATEDRTGARSQCTYLPGNHTAHKSAQISYTT